jgi:hypothetical protein
LKVHQSYVATTHAGAGELVFGASDLLRTVKDVLRETRKSGAVSASVHLPSLHPHYRIIIVARFCCRLST